MIGSCKNFAMDGAEMIFWRLSRTRAAAARILRRMSESSLLALSAISSSPGMEFTILSSRNRFVWSILKRWSMHVSFSALMP